MGKSKTGKHGSAKITCKLKMGYSSKTAQLMAPGHQQLEQVVVEKLEYTYSYIDGDVDSDESIIINCLDVDNNEVELKLGREREAVWKKVTETIAEAEENDEEAVLVVMEAPRRNKNSANGYDIYQIVIDAKRQTA